MGARLVRRAFCSLIGLSAISLCLFLAISHLPPKEDNVSDIDLGLLSLPGIQHFLPLTKAAAKGLTPAFRLAAKPRSEVSIVLGIPTMRRDHQSYLGVTLKSIFESLSEKEGKDCLVIVFVAETNISFVSSVAREIRDQFPEHINSGLLEVISPPAEFYPDMTSLRSTFGDSPDRVRWRSKQNLDFSFLMMYAQGRGQFYVQLEDDILTKRGFITTMKEFALRKSSDWFVIDYCQLGFIGKLFRTSSLPRMVTFFLMFFNDKPVDWLLDDLLHTMACNPESNSTVCNRVKKQLRGTYNASLFQHIGVHSSLKGKVQPLKDSKFGNISLFTPHISNPPARVETSLTHYLNHSLERAYEGSTFFWGLAPKEDDFLLFSFEPPIELAEFKLVSGNVEYPSDKFIDTDVQLKSRDNSVKTDFVTVGRFDSSGVAAGSLGSEWGLIDALRLSVRAQHSQNWVLLSEILIKTKV